MREVNVFAGTAPECILLNGINYKYARNRITGFMPHFETLSVMSKRLRQLPGLISLNMA